MKIVNNLIIFIFLTSSCRERKIFSVDIFSQTKSYINYKADTVMYKFNLYEGVEERIFMTERKMYVLDSCFGNVLTNENIEKAMLYAKSKDDLTNPYFVYSIKVLQNANFKELWKVLDYQLSIDNLYFPILETAENYEIDKKKFTLLKVCQKNIFNLNVKSINILLDKNNNWKIISKERITTDDEYNIINGYCIDTISKNLGYINNKDKNEINFFPAFDYYEGKGDFICNESKK